jgi:formamidopyrimidine-DNA glycosylase
MQSKSVVQDIDTKWQDDYPILATRRVVNNNQLNIHNININIQPLMSQASVNHQLQQGKLISHELAPSLAGHSILWHLRMKSVYQAVDTNHKTSGY